MSTKAKSVFAGMSLSEQTTLAPKGLDQRLFAPTPQPAPPPEPEPAAVAPVPDPRTPEESSNLPTKESRKVDTYKARNIGTKKSKNIGPIQPSPAAAMEAPYDFNLRPGRQANFLFTEEELDGLDDLKRDAKRTFDVRTTKQDLVRYAVVELLNDFAANGDGSRIIQWLKERQRRGK